MRLKLLVPQWHYSMLLDDERVGIFKEAIEKVVKEDDVVYDLGTGSGILAMIAARKAKKVYAVELDPITAIYAKKNVKNNNFDNIEIIEADAVEYNFKEKADVVIAEMLDTALITEPQVRVINSILKRKFLKENGRIIPEEVYNTAQLVESRLGHIYYDEEIESKPISDEILYSRINFYEINKEDVSYILEFEVFENCENPALRLATYTKLTDGIVAGDTPMLNPNLVIPLNKPIKKGKVRIKLSYKMGGDLESIGISVIQ
ncbi:50S ribosomal protein L11 methyltransferase [Methanotorris formicicus]|uniref:Ribosomal L11 methyltransferase n=1 Tax=Methanotorris formicicus Mc-S-70 TaxID=647171 RepID=H1KYR9_9EURY|nr:50S ribosomal protein L11 methyltransferase [Methanotorris formicicus]EHP86816.1 ribosomal L11 methyltransferase [Methanotorris formicicus Mc-S-70]